MSKPTASLYTDATTVSREDDTLVTAPKEQPEDAARFQARINWTNSTITKELISDINKEISGLQLEAEQLSVSYPQHKNHEKIIQCLIRVNTLKQIIGSFSNLNKK